MTRFAFIGERRSRRAQRLVFLTTMSVTWADGRLAAATLFRALRACGLAPEQHVFLNLYRDDDRPDAAALARVRALRRTHQIVGMGRRVQRALARAGIAHRALIHPAARGAIRRTDRYHAHVAAALAEPVAELTGRGEWQPPPERFRRTAYLGRSARPRRLDAGGVVVPRVGVARRAPLRPAARRAAPTDRAPTRHDRSPPGDPCTDDALRVALQTDAAVDAALGSVYERQATWVRRRLVRFGVDAETASDAVQEAMIALWRQRGRLPADVSLGAWLTTVAARRAIDARRIAGRLTVGWPDGFDARRLAAPAADAPLLRAEAVGQVRRLVGALAPDDRRLVALRYWREASLAEIARQTGLTAPAVESRLRRLRRHLRRAWRELEAGRPPPDRRRRRAAATRAPDP